MKAVMISIQPKWVEKIANGQKMIEVRKTAPEVPFKAYIYCTKKKPFLGFHIDHVDGTLKKVYTDHLFGSIPYFNGKVIGEFVCDKIIEWQHDKGHQYYVEYPDDCTSYFPYLKCHSEATGLKCSEIENYGKGKTLYGWHISDLKIYDKPKELSEFRKPCKINLPMCDRCEYYSTWNGRCENIIRAPQSWQYVEEL
jgi:predicted transcriptional regulator